MLVVFSTNLIIIIKIPECLVTIIIIKILECLINKITKTIIMVYLKPFKQQGIIYIYIYFYNTIICEFNIFF